MPSPALPDDSSLPSCSVASLPGVLEHVPVMAWMTGIDGRCVFANRSWLSFTARTLHEELGFGWTDRLHPEECEGSVAAYLHAHAARSPFRAELRFQRRDGVYRVMEVSGVPICDPGGEFHGYVGLCTDITELRGAAIALERERDAHSMLLTSLIATRQFRDISARKQFEAELHSSRQRLWDLAAHDEAVREEERRSAARMLHDELGQLLTSVKLEVAAASDVIRAEPDEHTFPAVDRLQAAAGLLDVCIRTVQQVAAKLRPAPIPEMRISDALRCEALLFEQRTKIRCRAAIHPARLELDRERSAVLYRILTEALTNVARHAAAGAVHLSLKRSAGVVSLSVRDNGRGIAPDEIDGPATMGLLGMRERALSVGGDVRITRGLRGGTTVMVILPLPSEPSHASAAADGPARR